MAVNRHDDGDRYVAIAGPGPFGLEPFLGRAAALRAYSMLLSAGSRVHTSPLTFTSPVHSLSFSSNELQVQRNPNGEEEGSSTG